MQSALVTMERTAKRKKKTKKKKKKSNHPVTLFRILN
jgi:hypothetical protein